MEDAFAQGGGRVIAQSATFPVPMPADVYGQITILNDGLGTLTDSPEPGPRSLDVLLPIVTDLAAGRSRTQYRLDSRPFTVDGVTEFAGVTGGATDPSLMVLYRER